MVHARPSQRLQQLFDFHIFLRRAGSYVGQVLGEHTIVSMRLVRRDDYLILLIFAKGSPYEILYTHQ